MSVKGQRMQAESDLHMFFTKVCAAQRRTRCLRGALLSSSARKRPKHYGAVSQETVRGPPAEVRTPQA